MFPGRCKLESFTTCVDGIGSGERVKSISTLPASFQSGSLKHPRTAVKTPATLRASVLLRYLEDMTWTISDKDHFIHP